MAAVAGVEEVAVLFLGSRDRRGHANRAFRPALNMIDVVGLPQGY